MVEVNRRIFLEAGLAVLLTKRLYGSVRLDWRQALRNRLASPRLKLLLDGDWLFLPAHHLPKAADPRQPSYDDRLWPTLDVPNFWRPIRWEVNSQRFGTSDRFLMREQQRVSSYRFDGLNTRAGWYRCWIDIPSELQGKRFVIRFGGVASIAQVWWNGESVGSHVGMFGPFECDVTEYVESGKANLLAVFVSSGQYVGSGNPREVEEIAVTVEITREMLNSLPQGGYEMMGADGGGGIWQSAEFVITEKVRIEDVFFKPRLDGGTVEVTVSNHEKQDVRCEIHCRVMDHQTGHLFFQVPSGQGINAPAGREITARIELNRLEPKLWSPEQPYCYSLVVSIVREGKPIDQVAPIVGFRTFEARGTQLYLNGNPYFLSGGNTPPYGLNPNSSRLAEKFIGLMHQGHQYFTRFHHTAPNDLWLTACDTLGVGACIEGEWPYVMSGNTEIPPKEIVDIWHRDQLEKFRSIRNHPSVLMWSLNNEWRFHAYAEGQLGTQLTGKTNYFDKDEARRLKKWEIVSAMVRDVRKMDGTRPIICSSEYTRVNEEYETYLKPRQLDDGDVDDIHVYNGTYGPSAFNLDVEQDIERRYANENRPLISLEPSTGYPGNDTGYFSDLYTHRHFVPQAWVGEYVLDDSNPMLKYHAVITKETIEKIRRRRTRLAGWVTFGNENWFRHPYDPEAIEPYATYYAAKLALSPVLISLDSMNRHFEEAQRVTMPVCVVNDATHIAHLDNLRLVWAILDNESHTLTKGEASMPDARYGMKGVRNVLLEMPAALPEDRNEVTLHLQLWSGDWLIARNEYSLLVTRRNWYRFSEKTNIILVGASRETVAYLESLGIQATSQTKANWSASPTDPLVIAGEASATHLGNPADLRFFLQSGGRVLFMETGPLQKEFLPLQPQRISEKYQKTWDKPRYWGAEYIDLAKNSPLSVGIAPVDDMRWWNANDHVGPRLADYVFDDPRRLKQKKGSEWHLAKSLADYIAPHGYLREISDLDQYRGSAVVDLEFGKGRLIASTLRLADDPVARKVLANLLAYVARKRSNDN